MLIIPFCIQAGFLGSWGEWHSSLHDLSENSTITSAVVEAELFTMLPPDRKINVRVPSYKLAGVLRRTSTGDASSPVPVRCDESPPPPERVACPRAYGGINETECSALGCCFDSTKPGVPWCFTGPAQLPRPVAAVTSARDGGERMGCVAPQCC